MTRRLLTLLLLTTFPGALAQSAAPQMLLVPREELSPVTLAPETLYKRLRNPDLKTLSFVGTRIRLEVAQALLEQHTARKVVRVLCGRCEGAIFADLRRFGVPMFTVQTPPQAAVLFTDAGYYSGTLLEGGSGAVLALESRQLASGYASTLNTLFERARRW